MKTLVLFAHGQNPELKDISAMARSRHPAGTAALCLLFASLLLLTACATRHPLGMDEAQWQALSAEQRLAAQVQQAELERAAQERRAAEARAREAEAQRRQAELDERRRTAVYGERVQCIVDPAEAYLGGKWRSIEALAVDLVQGTPVDVTLHSNDHRSLRYRASAQARFDGLTVSLCQGTGSAGSAASHCAGVSGTQADYRRGLTRRIDAKRFLRGQLRCDLVATGQPPYRKR